MDTLGLYISVPFCRSKCTYCNFASGVFPASYFARYIERVQADMTTARNWAAQVGAVVPGKVDTVYLGGGTPSILPAELLRSLFAGVRREFEVIPGAEITLECAPGQLEDSALAAMVECGVNRASFGVQSFIDREAKATGRLHTREIALRDIARVQQAGMRNVNVDLIAGLPHQTAESWRESLEVLCGAEVDHASVYMLEVDEDSRLGREMLAGGGRYHAADTPTDDETADLYVEAIETLAGRGLAQYEISNFARGGAESVHNKKYWQRRPYLGLGVDAHSMLRTPSGASLRFSTGDALQPFLEGANWGEPDRQTPGEELEEAWFLGLRLNAGVSLPELRSEFSETAVTPFMPMLAALAQDRLLSVRQDRVRLTAQGRLLSNNVFAQFVG